MAFLAAAAVLGLSRCYNAIMVSVFAAVVLYGVFEYMCRSQVS